MEYKNIRKKFYMKVIEILNGFRMLSEEGKL